ncbi:hypothetical protein KKF69_08410 [Patescibacteria group bacterium]|nr:hypothetical protein [Patescibacteria group bacterium]
MKGFIKDILIIIIATALIITLGSLIFQKRLPFVNFLTNVSKNIPPARPYKYVTAKPEGWFRTGQEADIVLYADDFNNSGGAASLNHPGKVATDGKRLIVADTYNNRVLIWNTIPKKDYTPADLVLGQVNMIENTPGTSADKLRWPQGVSIDGNRLAVADGYNDRILIWNTFPTQNGQRADLVIGQPDFISNVESADQIPSPDIRSKKDIWWPWDVLIYQDKFFVISLDGSLLIWNKFPTQNYQSADIVLGQKSFFERFKGDLKKENSHLYFKTPRSVAYDGNYLIVGDYNAHKMFVYKGLPTESGKEADFIYEPSGILKVATGVALVGGKLYATMDNSISVWEKPFSKDNEQHDFTFGGQKMGAGGLGLNSPYGLATDGKHLFVADTNSNRVLIYNKLPGSSNNSPDVVLGQKDLNTNRYVARNSRNNPKPYTDGNILIITDDYNGLTQVYKHLPDESMADADLHGVLEGNYLACGYKDALYCASLNGVYKWNTISEKPKKADYWSSFPFQQVEGLAVDDTSVYVSDSKGNRILVYNRNNFAGKQIPDFILGQNNFETTISGNNPNQLNYPGQVSSDGKHLAVADTDNKRILIWDIPISENGQQPSIIWDSNSPSGFSPLTLNLPKGIFIYNDRLFVSDTGNNRVLIWSKLPKNSNDKPDIVLGQKDFYGRKPSNAKDGLFSPVYLAFDGHYLWVGEFKWSDRLLRFSVQL